MVISSFLLKCTSRGGKPVIFSTVSNFPILRHKSVSIFQRSVVNAPARQLSLIACFTTGGKVNRSLLPLRSTRRCFHLTRSLLSDVVNLNVVKDVVIYKFDNTRLFRIVTLFAIVNFVTFLSITANLYTITTMEKDLQNQGGSSEFDAESSATPREKVFNPRERTGLYSFLDVESDTLRLAIAGICFLLAYAVLGASWVYCNNSVRFIVLRKGGKQVTVVTHGFFAKNRYHTHDLEKMTCRGNRSVSSALLLRVKNRYFSYIVDVKGEYTNPQLFDATVGVLRDIGK